MGKFSQYASMLVVIFGINFTILGSLNAEVGHQMEAYPPNYVAKDFKLSDINGDMHTLEDYRGKYVLLNFWTMSCNVCKSEMTTLQSAYDLLDRDNLMVISVHAGNPSEDVDSVLELNGISYPVLFDIDLQLGDWGVPIMPTTFIINPDGTVRYRAVGTRAWNAPYMIDFMEGILDGEPLEPAESKTL
ncbi:MAG: peroxiredoxin family protein [Gammaproteobacteria bacterium]